MKPELMGWQPARDKHGKVVGTSHMMRLHSPSSDGTKFASALCGSKSFISGNVTAEPQGNACVQCRKKLKRIDTED